MQIKKKKQATSLNSKMINFTIKKEDLEAFQQKISHLKLKQSESIRFAINYVTRKYKD